MRWQQTWAIVLVAASLPAQAATGITFGEWAASQGYSPGDVMPAVPAAAAAH